MSNSDKSAAALSRARQSRALASFYASNPGSRAGSSQSNTDKVAGLRAGPCCAPAVACSPPGPITNYVVDRYDSGYSYLTWNRLVDATSFTVTSANPADTITITGFTSATLFSGTAGQAITLTATNACGSSSASLEAPCFLAGSLVQMADGSARVIEEVAVGDWVLGAFGEINEVLALHRPRLGPVATMCRINDEHSTTKHHPHISVDRQFYCGDPDLVESSTYGREHSVIQGDGSVVRRFLHGLRPGRVQVLVEGINLKTVEGYRTVRRIDMVSMPPETQLYNLVTGGSHTYHVDGYAVTGWPREDDFDYDLWIKDKGDRMCSGCGVEHDD